MKSKFDLILKLAWIDFKLKYNNSIFGFFWSLLKPLLMLSILYIVFKIIIKIEAENYVLSLLLGLILWNFIVESTCNGMNSLISKSHIVKNINFSNEIIVISSVLNSFISLIFNLVIFCIIGLTAGLKFNLLTILILLNILLVFLLCTGISFILSTLYIKFRDLSHIWDVVLQIGFWAVPIAYPISMVPEKYKIFFLINPFARLIESSKALLINNIFIFKPFLINSAICLVIVFIGYLYFKKESLNLVDAI